MITSSAAVDRVATDVLVLGGGLAGLRAAIAARESGCRVALVFMSKGASPYVAGINAPFAHADPRDTPDTFFDDMVRGGYGLNDKRLVRVLTNNATNAIEEIEKLGVSFARKGEHFAQRHLSGNTYPRSVFIPDGAGRIMLAALGSQAAANGVMIFKGWNVLQLLKDREDVVGCMATHKAESRVTFFRARAVVLALGGLGSVYEDSTYPADVSADAYALAYDAGAKLIDMEFVQFEPTVTVHPIGCKGMEIPTAMLGDGAHLINASGERFMFRHNPEFGETRIEKARLSLCIQEEIDEGRGFPDGSVLFDTTVLSPEVVNNYVVHCQRLRKAGLDPVTEGPRVRPAAHSEMGGVSIDENCFTGVPGLFACGEAVGGVHGASRLAGNGGTEIIVFGSVAGRSAGQGLLPDTELSWQRIEHDALAGVRTGCNQGSKQGVEQVKAEIRKKMARSAGLYRHGDSLSSAVDRVKQLQGELSDLHVSGLPDFIGWTQARNMVLAARIVMTSALTRTESRGAHQRRDFPSQDDSNWLKHVVCCKGSDGQVLVGHAPIN